MSHSTGDKFQSVSVLEMKKKTVLTLSAAARVLYAVYCYLSHTFTKSVHILKQNVCLYVVPGLKNNWRPYNWKTSCIKCISSTWT